MGHPVYGIHMTTCGYERWRLFIYTFHSIYAKYIFAAGFSVQQNHARGGLFHTAGSYMRIEIGLKLI